MGRTMPDHPAFAVVLGFATETGNSDMVAKKFAQAARVAGIDVEPQYLNDIDKGSLAAATHFVVITATYGDGEMPLDAEVFWEELSGDSAHRLDHLTFAVCGLGDSYYPDFCNAGKLLDARLAELGARRLVERVDCDLDFEEPSQAWTTQVVALLAAEVAQSAAPIPAAVPVEDSPWHRRNPFEAAVLVNHPLTAAASDKSVRHYEIDLGDSGITYQAGDSLAVHPVNDPVLVDAVLRRLGCRADDVVPGHDQPLGALLTERYELRTPSGALQALVASRTRDEPTAAVLGGGDPAALTEWLYGRDVLDLLELADLDAAEVLDTLRPLQQRDYSIASSPLVHPRSIHLTVATVRYDLSGRARSGCASGFLADRSDIVRIHLVPNDGFRLPDPDVPIIMIGPGTGIAPFRAFLQERAATGATGRSWLFFGDRRRATDFLYGDELERYRATGVLTRFDTAFSRDGVAKDYVQQHMLTNADELYGWLQDGAHLYVCGAAEPMARDVHHTLHDVVSSAGCVDDDAAHAYVNDLITSRRYVRDVY